MPNHRSNLLSGPNAAFFEIEHEERIKALREKLIEARAIADGLEEAWQKQVAAYMPILEKKAGFIKGERYELHGFDEEPYNIKSKIFIYSHCEAYKWGVPGFYFFPTTIDGKKSKRGPFRLLDVRDASEIWKHEPMALQDSERRN